MLASEKELKAIPSAAEPIFKKSSKVDFADPVFQASSKGRVLVRNALLLFAGRKTLDDLPIEDRDLYSELLKKYS
jgi:hypothetical protein